MLETESQFLIAHHVQPIIGMTQMPLASVKKYFRKIKNFNVSFLKKHAIGNVLVAMVQALTIVMLVFLLIEY